MNDLTRPLGLRPKPPSRLARVPWLAVIGGAMLAALAVVVLWALVVNDPLGGRPHVTVAIEGATPAPAPKPAAPTQAPQPASTPPGTTHAASAAQPSPQLQPGSDHAATPAVTANGLPATEMQNGVLIVRGGTPPAGAVAVMPPTTDTDAAQRPTPGVAAAPSPALMDRGRDGPLPRIGADGSKPSEVYARPVALPAALDRAPRVALLVTGMGISQNGTAEAIRRLPGPVTLAFAPYGLDLDAVVQRARGAGHEVMLQTPMEPFDYPDSDPGPQSLLTSQTADQNIARLHWQMGRFTGYVGLTNFMGARFTSDAASLTPILREVAARGLIFADDGASPRSLVASLSKQAGLPAVTADVVIDAAPGSAAVDAALEKLEQTARSQGSALGVASGMPDVVARLAEWSAGLDKRGIALVPVTALTRR